LSLKIGDIKVSATGMIFNNPNLRTSMTLTKGQTFIEKWLDYHPDRNNPKAPLWCTNTGNKMGYENLSRIIKSIGNAAGYDGVRPHLYRHGYATFWSSKVPENMLAKMLGHSDTSAVQKYYVHLRMEDARKKQAEIEGKEIVEKEEMESILSPVICTTCTKINSHGAVFCAGCGDPLTEVGENKREGQIKDLKDSIAELKHLYNTQKTPDAYIEELALLRKENKRLNAKMVMLNKQMVSREELIELIKSRT
ncbi:MAG: site-specific integrase, partial [Thermoplasmata archaeon]|nr:site-specific integrase [Thermoplasmata archaeon]